MDTLCAAFDKISMDIRDEKWTLWIHWNPNTYILTIQDLLSNIHSRCPWNSQQP